MKTTKKIAIGLTIATGALFATWLVTGERAPKTKHFISRRMRNLKSTNSLQMGIDEDIEIYYV